MKAHPIKIYFNRLSREVPKKSLEKEKQITVTIEHAKTKVSTLSNPKNTPNTHPNKPSNAANPNNRLITGFFHDPNETKRYNKIIRLNAHQTIGSQVDEMKLLLNVYRTIFLFDKTKKERPKKLAI